MPSLNVEGRGTEHRSLGHQVALDGLRAVAVLSVMLFHLPTRNHVPGGLFGVDVFFALSGFLVTALLLGEYTKKGSIHLRGFLARRAWRLLPALCAFLGVYLVVALFFGHTGWFGSNPFNGGQADPPVAFTEALHGAGAVLSYGYNDMLAHSFYYPALGHLWSLSVEGQFYLLFPIVMWVVLRRWRRWLLPVTAVAATLSALSPWFIGMHGQGPNLIYYGSFTRIQGLLIGSVGAQLWQMGLVGKVAPVIRKGLATVSAGALAYLLFHVGNTTFKYQGALTLAPVAATIIVVHLAEPGAQGIGSWALSRRPVVWLGQRSYAIYLWHYVFACWTNLLPHDEGVPLTIAAALVAAELSWRLVEAPAQRWARRHRAARAAAKADVATTVPTAEVPVAEVAAASS